MDVLVFHEIDIHLATNDISVLIIQTSDKLETHSILKHDTIIKTVNHYCFLTYINIKQYNINAKSKTKI